MKTKIAMVLAILCSLYSFGQTIRVDDLLYHVTSANTVEIVGNYKSGVLTIPETITYNSINYQVKTIASRAFANSTGLTSVTIPNSVTDIGQSTFQDCISLTSIIFGNSITNISSYAFSGCQLLNTVIIGTSVTSIDDGAFLNCIGLTSIAIPTTVTNIGNSAFYACTGLTTVTIPNSVTNIGNSAFASCQGLTSVNVANGLISIGEKAFSGCYYLTNINIPNTVTSLGKDLFFSCSDLTSVTVNWTNPLSINRNVFDGLNVLNITLNVPAGTAWTYANAPVWNEFGSILQPIVVPVFGQTFTASGINYIVTKETLPYEAAVGSNSSFVGAATIPATVLNSGNSFAVTSIGDNAFNNCIGLSFVTMPNSITNIGILAFGGCYDLNSVTIPNSVISIGEAAFANCGGLISVAIPDSVLGIGADSFNSCFNLTSVNIPNSVTSIGNGAFSSCSSLTEVTVNWQTPLAINALVFDFVPIETAVLHVPDGTAALYGAAPVWQDFFKSKPEVESPQQFCGSATLSEVIVQGSPAATEFKWYDVDGNYLDSYSQIYSSATYYVSQVVNGIESLRTAVDVNLTVTDTPTVYDYPIPTCIFPITLQSYPNVTGSNLRWYDAVGNELDPTTSIDLNTASSNFYFVSQTIDDCESDKIQVSFRFPNPFISTVETTQYFKPADALAMNLLPNNNQWFREANDNNFISSFDALTDNTFYFVKEYNDDYCPIFTPVLVVIVPAPTAIAQTFSGTATVADLIVTATGTIKWYNADGVILENNVALTTGKYYVTQTIGNLESDTTEVEVTISSIYTAIPDANFEQALFDIGIDTINGDKQVLTSAIGVVTILDVSNKNISDLTGIEGFTGLKDFNCGENLLTTLNVSGLTSLQIFNCGYNQLTSLNLSGLTSLQYLECFSNQLTSLDLSGLTALQTLGCSANKLTSLNVNGLMALKSLNCSSNQLTTINISGLTSLQSLDCNNNQLRSLDLSGLTALQEFLCNDNKLTSLDLYGLIALQALNCSSNQLTSLDLNGLTALGYLDCQVNALTGLDLNGLIALQVLNCSSNELTSLEVTGLTALTVLDCRLNKRLTCIKVLDPAAAAANSSWFKDDTASYATNCNLQYTAIPDANFEQALFDLGIDTINGDKQVLTSAISVVKTLNVDNRNISDLTGIEGFTALQYLYCSRNQLPSLNLRGLSALQVLYCFSNQLTSLDLNGLTALQELGCASNQLKSLDLNGLTALQMFGCGSNQLKSLDFSSLTALQNLNCSGNQLTSLDLSSLIALQNLDCQNNALTSLNVSGLTALQDLICSSNKLTNLDLKDLSALQSLDCTVNQLTSINVSGLKALQTLNCSSNELTNLDLKGLTGLQYLFCWFNQLKSLDLNGLTAVQSFDCSGNQLESLNLSGFKSLNSLNCISNIGLTCITVLDPLAAAANLNWLKDATANFATNCAAVSTGSTAAVLSGSTAICSDNSATISVAITGGTSPYTVVYSNGISNSTVTGYVSGNAITVSPTTSTTYSLVSVTDAATNLGTGNSGTALITVNPKVTPTFTAIASICPGASLSALPTTSTNGITGIWSPALNNLATTTYTFTPSAGQCADSASLTITVNKVEPPIAEAQVVCSSSNIASLNAIGSNLLWYYNDYDTSPLNSTDSVYDTTYYVSQTVNGCESPRTAVQVTVGSAPEIYPVYDVYPCSSYILPYLSVGNYYTGPEGSGSMVPQGSIITTSQTLYIYAANNCGVSEQYFYISIHRPAQVDYLSDVTTCGSYTLPALSYGDFYTESYAGGNALYSGNVITSSQTVYIFNYGNCGNAESSFYINIENPEPPLATAQSFCDGATIANLTATGTAIQWYATAEGGSPLSGSDLLTTKTYYATQTLDRCESTNGTAVVVSINSLIIPTFTAVAPICSGETLTSLPTISNNGILGTWSPALNNLATTTYTFLPSVGQCANTTTLSITVNPKITPTFTAVAAICSGANLSALPTTSTNGITGTWLPALNNLATTTYTFTPSVGQCANTTTLSITVNPKITPTFTAVAAICSGASLSALPTTSTNGITGVWLPALNNLATTTYTFTPSVGQCANTTTLNIAVTPQPARPRLVCYQTATFNASSCSWDVTGTMPPQPSLSCYETATFNTTTCAWEVKGTKPVQPTLACYESATFDTTTCAWDVKGTAPLAPTGLETQTFVSGTLSNIMLSGSGIKWYASASDASTRTNELPLTTVLVDKTTYYATQTINGCESTSSKAVTVTVTLSVNEFDTKAFAYYPNPVSNELNLSYSFGLTSVRVTDILGRQLYFKKLHENTVKVDMSNMVKGVYFVEVTSDKSSKTIKVIKE